MKTKFQSPLDTLMIDTIIPMAQKALEERYGFDRLSKLEPWKFAAVISVAGLVEKLFKNPILLELPGGNELSKAFHLELILGILELPSEEYMEGFKEGMLDKLSKKLAAAETRVKNHQNKW